MLTPGTRLGPYTIADPLGAGGMGEVYRARDNRLGRDVAVKVLPADYSADPDRLRRFEQEARAAGMLNHPNILAIYDIGTHEGVPFVVSELLEGETLRERLGGTALSVRKAIDYALQVSQGLAAAHDKGIVHRDLKPENIFLTSDGRVKILDFGLAKLTHPESSAVSATSAPTEAATAPGAILGTAGYMSPEQVRGRPTDHRSDIFSFGAILYEMLTGKRAFRGDSAVETMNAILKEDPPDFLGSNRNVPPTLELERLVHHCLEKEPEQRFQSVRDIAFNLEALTHVSGSTTAGLPLAPAVSRWRAGWAVAAAVAIVAVLIAFLAGRRLGFNAAEMATAQPSYTQVTFRRGAITSAVFAPDGQTIVYSAAWDGNPVELFTIRQEFPESRPLGLVNARVAAISASGEMAVILGPAFGGLDPPGTLARLPLAGGSPREILEQVSYAGWGPDGKQLAVVHHVQGKVRLEFPIGRVLYETNIAVSYPRVSAKGDRVAFFDHPGRGDNRGSVAVVDLAGKKITLSTGWVAVVGLAWSRQNPDEVWFTAKRAGAAMSLYGVTVEGRQRLIACSPGDITLHDIYRDGRALVTRNSVRLVAMVLAPGETRERDLSWFDYSYARDLSADGKLLVFDEQGGAAGPNYAACIRKTDGTPPIRLGEGMPGQLSPDGKWVPARHPDSGALSLLPTGAGDPRPLKTAPVEMVGRGSWFPDSRRWTLAGREPGARPRCYAISIEGDEKPKPLTPEDTTGCAISPDGKWIATAGPGPGFTIFPLDGGAPRPVPGLEPTDTPIQWSSDAKSFYVARYEEFTARIYRLDLATGRRTPWKVITVLDRAGLTRLGGAIITPDGKHYAYRYSRTLSDLYLVEGLR